MADVSETKHTAGQMHVEVGLYEPQGSVHLLSIGSASVAGVSSWVDDGKEAVAEARANAARLALRWNAHDALVEALKAAEDLYQIGLFNAAPGQVERVHELRRAALALALATTPPASTPSSPTAADDGAGR